MKQEIEQERQKWQKIAKENNWNVGKVYVQVWYNADYTIRDSVSHKGLTGDIILIANE